MPGGNSGNNHSKDRVTLVVDETPFVVDSKIFNAHQNTLLGRMFANKNFELKANARGEYDIGRGTCLTSTVFRLILVTFTHTHAHTHTSDIIGVDCN